MLKLTDVYMMSARVDSNLRAEVYEHYTPAQALALTLRAVGYTSQKMLVGLGIDIPFWAHDGWTSEDGLLVSEYDGYINRIAGDEITLPTTKRERIEG